MVLADDQVLVAIIRTLFVDVMNFRAGRQCVSENRFD